MKVAINACFGGFGLSPLGHKRLAELQGRECYFFKHEIQDTFNDKWTPITIEEASSPDYFGPIWAFDVPDIANVLRRDKEWHDMTNEEKSAEHDLYQKHQIEDDPRDEGRADPLLVQVIEALGEEANGHCASLAIVEVPDGVKWHIDEYDGNEHVAEDHRTWYAHEPAEPTSAAVAQDGGTL